MLCLEDTGTIASALHKIPTDPLIKLPSDIVSYVFHHSLQYQVPSVVYFGSDPTAVPLIAEPSVRCSPLLLCQVSRRWRDAAIERPTLWSQIALTFYPSRDARAFSHLRMFLERSQKAFVSISLDVHSHNIKYPIIRRIFEVLAPEASRIQDLQLSVDSIWAGRLMGELGALPSRSLDHLQSLDVFVRGYTAEECASMSGAASFAGLSTATRLRRIKLCISPFDGRLFHLPFPWPQLTVLTLSLPPTALGGFLSILGNCTQIDLCHLIVENDYVTDNMRWTQTAHSPTLKHLRLSFQYAVDRFIQCIIAPALSSFFIEHDCSCA